MRNFFFLSFVNMGMGAWRWDSVAIFFRLCPSPLPIAIPCHCCPSLLLVPVASRHCQSPSIAVACFFEYYFLHMKIKTFGQECGKGKHATHNEAFFSGCLLSKQFL